ncbi:hypothetical protein [Lacihabitans sp. LS3-19]|uniref:hypothetical protein n=1 Tax=Lacihabitans sp. LS3-19 TaxID=2487335 RepID=UPI0020CEF34B|nr:hypothetical protein [Lacihabitans sp. LS3-19]
MNLSFFFGIGPLLKLPKGKKKMAAIGVSASMVYLIFLIGITLILLGASVGD